MKRNKYREAGGTTWFFPCIYQLGMLFPDFPESDVKTELWASKNEWWHWIGQYVFGSIGAVAGS